jgi:hypothetical protein
MAVDGRARRDRWFELLTLARTLEAWQQLVRRAAAASDIIFGVSLELRGDSP